MAEHGNSYSGSSETVPATFSEVMLEKCDHMHACTHIPLQVLTVTGKLFIDESYLRKNMHFSNVC